MVLLSQIVQFQGKIPVIQTLNILESSLRRIFEGSIPKQSPQTNAKRLQYAWPGVSFTPKRLHRPCHCERNGVQEDKSHVLWRPAHLHNRPDSLHKRACAHGTPKTGTIDTSIGRTYEGEAALYGEESSTATEVHRQASSFDQTTISFHVSTCRAQASGL